MLPGTGEFVIADANEDEEVAQWPPADTLRQLEEGGSDLLLLPDSMYALVPQLLPGCTAERRPMRIEFGGLMHNGAAERGSVLRRMVVGYGSDGQLESITHNKFLCR